MPGNRAIYDRAMDQSREAARQKRWDDALRSAARAVQEFPHDTDARTSVAVGLFYTGKYAKALHLLNELRTNDQQNPFFLEYIARAHEQQGQTDEAVQVSMQLVELHRHQRSIGKVVETLRNVLRLRPDLNEQRETLAHLLVEMRSTSDAVAQYLELARRLQAKGQLDAAAQHGETAVRLDPENREAKELIMGLRGAMASAAGMAPAPADDTAAAPTGAANIISGTMRSQQFVLEKMASDALELQEAGDLTGAVAKYEEVIGAGLERADIFYSLGLLYQERSDHPAAIAVLRKAATDPEYALSAHYALGSSHTELNQPQQAAQEFEQAIHMVDLATVGKAESEDLIQMYEQVTSIHQQLGDLARAASLYSTLANFLKTKRWGREQAAEFTQRAKDLTDRSMLDKLRTLGTGSIAPPPPPPDDIADLHEDDESALADKWGKIPSIMDFLQTDDVDVSTSTSLLAGQSDPLTQSDPLEMLESLPTSEVVVTTPITPLDTTGLGEQAERWVLASERYIEQGLLDAAVDTCYEVMQLNLDYLPIHLRIGEIYERQQAIEDALGKYQTLIDTYTVRGEPQQAIDVYFRLVQLSPEKFNARSRLADLLHQAERNDEAAAQLGEVADSYFRIGQTNRALEEYRRGLQWAPKHRDLRTRYGLALFKLERYEAARSEFYRVADSSDPISVTHLNMTMAMLRDAEVDMWDSLAALLELLGEGGSPESNLVQAEYRAALLVADDPLLHYMLAVVQQHANQHSSALLELEQGQELLEAEPEPLLPLALVHQAMASSYIALEQASEALEQLQKAQRASRNVKANPAIKHKFARTMSQGDVVRYMAEAYAANDDLAGAEQALREALKMLPYNQDIYTKLAEVCFQQGKLTEAVSSLIELADYQEGRQDLDSAIRTLEYALKLAPGSIQAGGKLARIYIRRGYPDQGVEGLLRVSDQERREGQLKDAIASLQQAAEIRWMQGRPDETLAVYDRIVQIAPNDVEARQWRAIMYTLVGRSHDAIQEKKEIVRLLIKSKELENAIAELHQIIGLDLHDLDAYYMLGDLLMQRHEYAQAVSLYKRMLKMPNTDTDRIEALLSAAQHMVKGTTTAS